MSAKRAAVQRQRIKRLRAIDADQQRCQWPTGCAERASDAHESRNRSQGGDPTDPDWLLCRVHHDQVTAASGPFRLWCIEQSLIRTRAITNAIDGDITTDTMPGMSDDAERQQISVRLSPALLARIDERAGRHRRSRNEWIELALTRTVDMPTQITNRQEKF